MAEFQRHRSEDQTRSSQSFRDTLKCSSNQARAGVQTGGRGGLACCKAVGMRIKVYIVECKTIAIDTAKFFVWNGIITIIILKSNVTDDLAD